jgi:hypothetical protein
MAPTPEWAGDGRIQCCGLPIQFNAIYSIKSGGVPEKDEEDD